MCGTDHISSHSGSMSILQIGLGQLYYQGGRGVEVDHELAFYYFSKASAGGNPTADAYLGKIYAEGSGSIDQDYAAAYEYFTKAAEEVGKHTSSSKLFVWSCHLKRQY